MTVIGWIQILLYCAIIVALTPLLGGYMTRVFKGERTFLTPVLRPVELMLYRAGGDRRETRAGLADLHGRHAALPCRRLRDSLRADAPSGPAAVQSGGAIGRRARSVVQYGGQLHHQHQLAELRRRKHDVLSRADARPDPPEFPVGGHRHCPGCRAHSRLCTDVRPDNRQFLGRYHPLHALCPVADLRCRRAVPGVAGHAADARPLCRGDDAGRRQADHCGRAGCLAGRDQDAGHQWRRFL